jgi:hypothetical protein
MIKDRAQKASALRLCVSKRWVPYMEVDVEPSEPLDKGRVLLTDLDVLAVAASPIGRHTRYLFDCKSGLRESAIGRSFWLRGVMARVGADHGFVVLNDKLNLPADHRVSAADLNVTLLQESEFEQLAVGMGGTTHPFEAACASLDAWEWFLEPHKHAALDRYMRFARSGYWRLTEPGTRCRHLIAELQLISAELDPAKPRHFAIYTDALALLLLAVSELASHLFLVLLKPATSEELSSLLVTMLFGGQANLEAVQRLRNMVRGPESEESMPFPQMRRFEQLVRQVLQAPAQGLHASLLARDVGYSEGGGLYTTAFQLQLIEEANFIPKFVMIASDFLRRAARLPPDMDVRMADITMQVFSLHTTARRSAGDGGVHPSSGLA